MRNQNTPSDPIYMSKAQACKRYGFCLRYISMLIEQGIIPSVKLGRRCIRIPIAKADEALESLTTGGIKQ
jgi:excisionase family DNA binding protein